MDVAVTGSRHQAAVVRVAPDDALPQRAWGTTKRTYRIDSGRLVPTEPAPLRHDIWREDLDPRWPPGSDYWPFKAASDVVVLGKAFGPGGRAVSERQVAVRVGHVAKRVQVLGTRFVEWTASGRPRLGAPQPFTEMELAYTNAYGGVDLRVPVARPTTFWERLRLEGEHPGMYPRNQSGKGYLVVDAPIDGVELPNLEDPDDRLTPDNLLVRDPARWHAQPLSWFLDWQFPAMFPRAGYMGARPWFEVPADVTLPEVRRGFMPEAWRGLEASLEALRAPPPIYFQEASLGMTFGDLREGTPVEVVGMHPEHERLRFALPRFPSLAIEVEGDRQPVEAKLLHVVITPHEERVEITWAGVRDDMPRAFFPGIHGHIPITLHADGEAFAFETPEPIYEQIKRAEDEGRMPARPRGRRPGEKGYVEIMGALLPAERPQRERDQVGHADAPRFGSIDPVAGRLLLTETDWVWPGAGGFAFQRFYSSSMAWRPGELGLGWSHPLEASVWEEHGWVLYRMQDGREIGVPVAGGELGLGGRAHHPNAGVTLLRVSSDGYEARHADGARFGFTRVRASVETGPPRARLTRIWAPDGSHLDVRYDTHGRLDRLLLPGGAFVRFEHDARGRLTRVFAPTADGRDHAVVARYTLDASGQVREAVDAAGRVTTYRYEGRLLVERRAGGERARRFAYDGVGARARCVAERWDEGEREVLWNAGERVAGLVDAGGSFSVRANAALQADRVLDRFGHAITREHDEASGLLSREADPDGETRYLYDAAWHLALVSAPGRGDVALDHDDGGRLTRLTDADGRARQQTWDHLGRLTSRTEPDGASTVFHYAEEGALETVTLAGERTLRLARDPRSGAVVGIDADGAARRARRDAQGRVAEITDEVGHAFGLRYDASGRVRELRASDDLRLTLERDAAGQVTRRHDGSRDVAIERDADGRLAHVDEGGGGLRAHRDAEGRVTLIESEALDYWELRRDAAGRVQEEVGFGGLERHVLRDHAGRVRRESAGRVRTDVQRDAAGRPVTLEHADGSFQRLWWSDGGRLVRCQDADRVTRFERDGAGRVVREASEGAELVSRYDASGNRVALDGGGLSLRVVRDARGGAERLVATWGEARLELSFTRDAAGRERSRALPGGLEVSWARDSSGRPTRRVVAAGARELAATDYRYRGLSRLAGIRDARGARELVHDARGRLVRVGALVRALDAVGHVYRTEARDDHRYAHGRLLEAYGTEYAYDDAGRRVSKETALGDQVRYRWDGAGRLAAVELSADLRIAYDYDGLGRLIHRRREARVDIPGVEEPVWEPTSQTRLVWDGLCVLQEITDGATTTWIREAGALVGKLGPDGAFAVLTDPVGAPSELIDRAGDLAWRGAVDAFGTLGLEVDDTRCPWRFMGHWEDPDTGLAHAWLRVYDPETGAYLSPNPLGVIAGADLYGYLPDPLSETSPLGLGRGYATLGGEVPSERLAAELLARRVAALDRGEGVAGPRRRFDPRAAGWDLADPEALLWGAWEPYRPSRCARTCRVPQPRGLRRR